MPLMQPWRDPEWVPETQYARNGDVHIAYQVFGEGDVTFVGLPPIISNIEVGWENAEARYFLTRMASFCRFVHFDKRGQGMSDRSADVPTMDQRLDDLMAVLDAVGAERAVLGGISEGGSTATMFAATHPDRVAKLMTFAALAAPDVPAGDMFMPLWAEHWGTAQTLTVPVVIPSKKNDAAFLRWINRFERQSASPGALLDAWKWIREIDVRPVLESIQCPTLVMHRRGDRLISHQQSEEIASHIPGAQLAILDGDDHIPWFGDADTVLTVMEDFITDGRSHASDIDRVLATVVFTDIVDSTRQAASVGDAAWRAVLDRHDTVAARTISAHGGRLIKSTGDGVVATFDAPGRALRCADALRKAVADAGIHVRCGIHTGEIELRGSDIGGIAVHIAARVEAHAEADEVLVSRTVRDLVAGSGYAFTSRGTHQLKGVPDEWELFAVAS
jgi:class 3 adenylate cyclase